MQRREFLSAVAAMPVCVGVVVAEEKIVPAAGKTEAEVVAKPIVGAGELLPKMLAESKVAVAKLRDYTGHLIRQERAQGKLTAEQIVEIRCRTAPQSMNLKIVKPLNLAGEETTWHTGQSKSKVRYRPTGVEGVRGFQTHDHNAAKVLTHTMHPANEVGFAALIDRVEKMLAVEKRMSGGAAVYASEFTFAGKPVIRFEILADRAHPARYAPHCIVYVETESKLPVRFEAYDAPKIVGTPGELIESQSYIDLKFNVGLGENNFTQ